jgi:hypothetical protein
MLNLTVGRGKRFRGYPTFFLDLWEDGATAFMEHETGSAGGPKKPKTTKEAQKPPAILPREW